MKIVEDVIVSHREVRIELSCGMTLNVTAEIDEVLDDANIIDYLQRTIKNLSYFAEEDLIDVYTHSHRNGQQFMSRGWTIKPTPSIMKLIKDNNEGGVATCHPMGTDDKDAILQFIKEVL